ncbi:MAG: MaoC family dehydratase N-terminal domain-containing protein [Chloroflexi bacterium]|nr:MaoC family dehydratase N-terminal domain-containing protein [Chloroflexota bacterium]
MTTTFPRITEEGLAELRKKMGVEAPTREQFNCYATPDNIKHFAWSIGDTNPLFTDEEYGKKTRWGAVVAPPTFLFTTFGRGAVQGLPGVHAMWSGADFEMYLPITAGDRITSSVYLSALDEKLSAFARRTVRQEWTYNCRNQRGEFVAKVREWSMRTERDTARARGKYKYLTPAHYTQEDMERIWADYDREEIRGATPRHWEDVKEGEELAPVVKGPLRVTDCIAWKIGWGFYPFVLAHKIFVDYVRRHPGLGIPNEYGVPDVPERVHWDSEFARRVGVPAAYDYGPQRTSWLCQVVTNWMGDDGFIKRYRSECRRFNIIGDTTWCKGRVKRKYVEGDEHLVELDLWCEDQRGETTQPGLAVVRLPSKGG